MTIGPSFPEVLRAARRGDRSAVAVIYQDVAPVVIGYLRSNRVRDAEDVAGDVFVSMMRSIGRFQGDEHRFRSWLLTIAHRRMVDHVRRALARSEHPVEVDGIEPDLAPAPPADEQALGAIEAGHLVLALDGLTSDQRSVLMLRALADLTVPEIARVVGKPETAVKALLRRGVARLSRGRDGDGPDDGIGPAAAGDREVR